MLPSCYLDTVEHCAEELGHAHVQYMLQSGRLSKLLEKRGGPFVRDWKDTRV